MSKKNKTTPFTYLLKHIPSGKFYYGVRYAEGCHPNDLFHSYFTSSKEVKKLIDKDGKDSFIYETRKMFRDTKSAQKWELKVLRRLGVPKNKNFINKGLCTPPSHKGIKKTAEHKQKISLSNIGKHDAKYALLASNVAKLKNTGRKRPNHSKIMKEFWKNNPGKRTYFSGEQHHFFGKKHSSETKKLISEKIKHRPLVCCVVCHKGQTAFKGMWTCHFFNHHTNC